MPKRLEAFLTKIEPPNWLMPVLFITALFRLPSIFSPYFYGDEMIYLTLGNAIKNGLTLYSQIHDNKTPLIYLVASFAGNLYWFRAILLFWMLLTIIIFWHLAKTLFKDNIYAQKIAVIIFAVLTTIPLFEGQIVNSELFLIGPTILAFVFLLNTKSNFWIFMSGVLFAIAVLFKVPAVFDVPVIILFWLIKVKDLKSVLDITKKTAIIIIGFLIPIVLTFIWYYLKGAGTDYLRAAFLQNIGYLSSWSKVQEGTFLSRNIGLIVKGIIILVSLFILRIYNKKLTTVFIIGTVWLLTSLFAATLSARPYPHYLVQSIPAISLLIGVLITSQKFDQVLSTIPLSLALFVPVYYKFWYYPTVPYYVNFTKFITNKNTKEEYFSTFDMHSSDNYNLAKNVIKITSSSDKIFVWGEEAPTIYALTKRIPAIKYVANYHINDFSTLEETANSLEKDKPEAIIILNGSQAFKEISSLLSKNYILINNSTNNSEIWHLKVN